MRSHLVLSVVVIFVQSSAAAVVAAPPKVVKAEPENGDIGVDPSLNTIRIVFDQPMGRGMSVVGGGEEFPTVLGRGRWVNSRTLVIKVKLEPNHDYWLSINNQKFQNFRNRSGEPAIPYPIRFRTGAGKRVAGSKEKDTQRADGASHLTSEENARAVRRLRTAIRDHYSYRDRLGIDWQQLFASQESSLTGAHTPTEFAKIAGTLLARAQDKHIWFQVGDDIIPSFVRPSVPNANPSLIRQLVPGLQLHGKAVASGRWDDGIGYLAIASWNPAVLKNGKVVLDALNGLRDTRALIIDVRLNGGGDETVAQQVAGCFVGERKLYAKNVYRTPGTPNGFTAPKDAGSSPIRISRGMKGAWLY